MGSGKTFFPELKCAGRRHFWRVAGPKNSFSTSGSPPPHTSTRKRSAGTFLRRPAMAGRRSLTKWRTQGFSSDLVPTFAIPPIHRVTPLSSIISFFCVEAYVWVPSIHGFLFDLSIYISSPSQFFSGQDPCSRLFLLHQTWTLSRSCQSRLCAPSPLNMRGFGASISPSPAPTSTKGLPGSRRLVKSFSFSWGVFLVSNPVHRSPYRAPRPGRERLTSAPCSQTLIFLPGT